MALGRRAGQRGIQIEGLDELRDQLANVAPREANNILRAAVHGLAGQVRDEMRARVPTRTTALQKSIRAVRRRGKPNFPVSEVRGGGGAPYMLMTEFGTSHSKAQPFIVPTVEAMRPGMADEYRKQFGKKLERALARKAKRSAT